ncbi:MAG: hypothetical protein LBE91_21500 [Tannerella sp.]|jgi:hypothetical protein|nr:hypothetical protein [Tannerella sp.]
MEDLGNYIYVIVIVIAALSGLLGKSKKKQPATTQKPQQQSPPSEWEDVLGELFGTPKSKPQTQPQPVSRPVSPTVTKPQMQAPKSAYKPIYQSIDEIRPPEEGVRAIETKETNILDMEEDMTGLSLDDIPNEAEDWRKVFVYNEIFNRKYG